MRLFLYAATILCVLVTPLISGHAIERVYLKSGSTLIADSHVDHGDLVEVVFHSESKVFIRSQDIDKIAVETSAPIDLSTVEFDPEKALPDVSDPLNEKWLDKPVDENPESARVYLPFMEQVKRGYECPLARNLEDVRYARRKKVPSVEFFDRTFYLGMDMQYHEDPGLKYDAAFKKLMRLEESRNSAEVLEFIQELRQSAFEARKEYLLAQAIELRDKLDPGYGDRQLLQDSWTAQARYGGGSSSQGR